VITGIGWLLMAWLTVQEPPPFVIDDRPADTLTWASREFKRGGHTDALVIILLPPDAVQVCTEMWRKATDELVGKHCWTPKTRYEADEWPDFSFEHQAIEAKVFAYLPDGGVLIATKVMEAGEDPLTDKP